MGFVTRSDRAAVRPAGLRVAAGHLNDDGFADLIVGVNIALDNRPPADCPAFENAQGVVDIAQLITGVNNALHGCGGG